MSRPAGLSRGAGLRDEVALHETPIRSLGLGLRLGIAGSLAGFAVALGRLVLVERPEGRHHVRVELGAGIALELADGLTVIELRPLWAL